MKFKLDENFGIRIVKILRDAGYEAHTFQEQGLQGISDQQVYDLCCAQKLCLITLTLISPM